MQRLLVRAWPVQVHQLHLLKLRLKVDPGRHRLIALSSMPHQLEQHSPRVCASLVIPNSDTHSFVVIITLLRRWRCYSRSRMALRPTRVAYRVQRVCH